jgi:protease I
MGRHLEGVRVAAIAVDGFEQVELTRPMKKLREEGAEVEVVSLRPGAIRGMNFLSPGIKVKVDRTIYTADPDDYDALLIPGGLVNPDLLRQSKRILNFVRSFDEEEKPIAAICHGPWVLISAGLVEGRRLTSWPGIRDDVENAGGLWENKSLVHDGNWITSRGPQDLLQFNRGIVDHFGPGTVARERRYPIPGARLALGAVVVAAVGYAVRRAMDQGGEEWELPPSREGGARGVREAPRPVARERQYAAPPPSTVTDRDDLRL